MKVFIPLLSSVALTCKSKKFMMVSLVNFYLHWRHRISLFGLNIANVSSLLWEKALLFSLATMLRVFTMVAANIQHWGITTSIYSRLASDSTFSSFYPTFHGDYFAYSVFARPWGEEKESLSSVQKKTSIHWGSFRLHFWGECISPPPPRHNQHHYQHYISLSLQTNTESKTALGIIATSVMVRFAGLQMRSVQRWFSKDIYPLLGSQDKHLRTPTVELWVWRMLFPLKRCSDSKFGSGFTSSLLESLIL